MRDFDKSGVTLVHMIRRARDLAPRDFQRAWLGIDLQAVALLPGLVRYGQNHALLQGYAKGELPFDGFAEYEFADPDSLAEARGSAEWAALDRAGERFTDAGASLFATVNISVQKAGTPPRDAIRSTEFVNRRPDLPMTAFRRYWIEEHGPLARGIPQIIRYEQNHLDDRDHAGAAPRFDGWAATWFTDTTAMRDAAREPVYGDTRADEPNFLAGPLPVLFTRERLSLLGG